MMENVINEFKQQLIVELCNFIDEPNNRKTQRQMVQAVQDLNNKFNDEGRHITVDADLIAGFNGYTINFNNYERNTDVSRLRISNYFILYLIMKIINYKCYD